MSLRGDFNLLKFETYSEYLTSFTKVEEYRYLSNMEVIKSLMKLGYRSNSTIYEESEFYKIKKYLKDLINPIAVDTQLFGKNLVGKDPALVALVKREERNVHKKLSTIIFLQLRQRNGFDISGYIDYADSLRRCSQHQVGSTNWQSVFECKTLLRPNRTHLSYYDWKTGTITYNHSDNFEVIHYGKSLMFKHWGDHKIVPVTTADTFHNDNVQRKLINSPIYGCVILYDHFVRKAS